MSTQPSFIRYRSPVFPAPIGRPGCAVAPKVARLLLPGLLLIGISPAWADHMEKHFKVDARPESRFTIRMARSP